MKHVHRHQRARGFTLVELMIGLAVGLFVSLAAISIFVSTRSLQTVSSSDSRRGENARLALDLLHKDFRSAGFDGCRARLADPPISLLNAGSALFLDGGTSGLAGAHGNGSTFVPALGAAFLAVAPTAPSANSDVVSMRVPVEPLSLGLAAVMTTTTGVPSVGVDTPGNTIAEKDIVLIANCKTGAIFQVTEANPASSGLLTHAIGGAFNPGNASADLGQVFRGDSAVYRLQTHHYYIADSVQRPGTRSLWRFIFPNAGAQAQEVAQGIDRMLVSYGVDDNNDQTVDRYVTADSVVSWDMVVAVRVQLLSETVKDNVAMSAQSVTFNGTTATAADRRLRAQLTEVIALRSRAP